MFPLPHFPSLQNRADFSTPAFSTPAKSCRCFHSCIFHPCRIVPIFPLLHFNHLHFLVLSCRYFHSRFFHSRILSAPGNTDTGPPRKKVKIITRRTSIRMLTFFADPRMLGVHTVFHKMPEKSVPCKHLFVFVSFQSNLTHSAFEV